MFEITLKCFDCGAKKDIIVESPPTFAFELVKIAKDAGMIGTLDIAHGRTLVFCNDECCNNSKTKKGTFRIRPRKVS